jgi:thiol-disulfide isomerase/thioredoxin
MAYTESNMMPLGTVAPEFELPDTVSGQRLKLSDIRSDKATVIIFMCNHCPYVVFVKDEIVRIAAEYSPKGVAFAGINANDVEHYPDDAPDKMTLTAKAWGINFPYLFDESQAVARAYDAACTPEFYVFDGDLRLVYRGQLDNARPKNGLPVTGSDLRTALDAVLENRPVYPIQRPGGGCNIKWKV